jgi:hypothetical protein
MIIREISILMTRKARTEVPKQFFEVKERKLHIITLWRVTWQ